MHIIKLTRLVYIIFDQVNFFCSRVKSFIPQENSQRTRMIVTNIVDGVVMAETSIYAAGVRWDSAWFVFKMLIS